MALHLDERSDGGFALYIDGDFQFDTADEAIYHESLALPALSLANAPKRVLICGGGDGLALRECLRFPGIIEVDLVDYDESIIALARDRFAALNRGAFDDPRVRVHLRDAWEFLDDARSAAARSSADNRYDVILCDFTVPRTPDHARIFTREWYERLAALLTPGGMMALNALSPQTTPEAFWCLTQTVRAAQLSVLPYHVCIPSFRAHGYGAWAFLLASNRALSMRSLRCLACPVATRQADLSQLWRGARFTRAERSLGRHAPVHSLANEVLVPLLLNPGAKSEAIDSAVEGAYDLEPLLRQIPISHPYHTRIMIETLAEQVAKTIQQIDIRRLVDALLRRSASLTASLRAELTRLRDYLSDVTIRWDRFMTWGARLFAALVVLMTIANAIAPDNAFAKGSAGLGHSGVSRGYSGSFGGSGRMGGGARSGSFSGSGGSFGRTGSFGSHGIFSSVSAPSVRAGGFRTSYSSGHPIDLYGQEYHTMPFRYYYGGSHTYFGGGNSAPPQGPQVEHKPLFAADDDLLVMDNGDVIVTLSDHAFLLVTGGKVVLRSDKSPDPLAALYADPAFFDGVLSQLQDRQAALRDAISVRRDWLSWVGWTSALVPAISQDKTELSHMQDLDRRLGEAIARMGRPPTGATPLPPLEKGQVELFVDARLREDGAVALRQEDGSWIRVSGGAISPEGAGSSGRTLPCPPALSAALSSVISKLSKEMKADIAAHNSDLRTMQRELSGLQTDLGQYDALLATHDPGYQVDYGTDEIPVSEAIRKTQLDIDQENRDIALTTAERDKLIAEQSRLEAVAPSPRQ